MLLSPSFHATVADDDRTSHVVPDSFVLTRRRGPAKKVITDPDVRQAAWVHGERGKLSKFDPNSVLQLEALYHFFALGEKTWHHTKPMPS